MKHENIYKLTLTALMAALSYVVFTFLQIKVTLPGGDATSFHLGNAVCVLGALLLGGVYGGIGGAIGMTIGRSAGSGLYCVCAKDIYFEILYRSDHRTDCTQDGSYLYIK